MELPDKDLPTGTDELFADLAAHMAGAWEREVRRARRSEHATTAVCTATGVGVVVAVGLLAVSVWLSFAAFLVTLWCACSAYRRLVAEAGPLPARLAARAAAFRARTGHRRR